MRKYYILNSKYISTWLLTGIENHYSAWFYVSSHASPYVLFAGRSGCKYCTQMVSLPCGFSNVVWSWISCYWSINHKPGNTYLLTNGRSCEGWSFPSHTWWCYIWCIGWAIGRFGFWLRNLKQRRCLRVQAYGVTFYLVNILDEINGED